MKRFFLCLLIAGFTISATASVTKKWKSPAAWKKGTVYNGDYAIDGVLPEGHEGKQEGTGDTVTQGDYATKPMYWWAKWYSDVEEPGTITKDSGGTNPWVFMNNWGIANKGSYTYKFVSAADISSQTGPKAIIPTYRNGAKGAYSIHHDDICALQEEFVQNSWDIANKYGIQIAWGAKVNECDADWYQLMKDQLKNGHEITCHSNNHTSAADQWAWVYPGMPASEQGTLGIEYLEGNGNDTMLANFTADSTMTTGESYTNVLGQVLTINKAAKTIKTNSSAWSEKVKANVKMVKYYSKKGWTDADYKLNVNDAKAELDKNVYADFLGNQFFPKGKKTEFYIYPYDAFSVETHKQLDTRGFISARGGSKSGKVHRGDLYHPFFIDFDAYYLKDNNPDLVVPNNPHQLLTLEGMVDKIIAENGYMIRELHAVADSGGAYWGAVPKTLYDTHLARLKGLQDNNELVVQTVSEAVKYFITRNACKTANLTGSGTSYTLEVTTDPAAPASTDAGKKYQDEITVLCKFPDDWNQLAVYYAGTSKKEFPRYLARKIGANTWSIGINPYKGKVEIYGNEAQTGISGTPMSYMKSNVRFIGLEKNNLKLFVTKGEYTVALYNASGKSIRSFSGKALTDGAISQNIAATTLSNGFYLLKVRNNNVNMSHGISIVK